MSKDGPYNGNKTLKEYFNSTTEEFFYEELPDIVLNFLKGKTNCTISKLGDRKPIKKGLKVKFPEGEGLAFKSKVLPPSNKKEGLRLVKQQKRPNISSVLKSQISSAVTQILQRTENNPVKRTRKSLSNNVSVTGSITRRKQTPALPFVKQTKSVNTLPSHLLKTNESSNKKRSEKNSEHREANTEPEHWPRLTVDNNNNIYFTPSIESKIFDKDLCSSVLAKISLDSFLEVAKVLQCPSELKTSIIQNSTSYFERYLNKKHGIYFVDAEQDSKNSAFDNIVNPNYGVNEVEKQPTADEPNLLNICIKSIEDQSNVACLNLFTNSNETVDDSAEKQSESSSAELKEAICPTSCEETSLSGITNSVASDKDHLSKDSSRKKKITISLSYKQLVKLVKSLETAPLDQGNAVTINLGNANPKHILELKVHNTGKVISNSSKGTKKTQQQSKNVINEINKLQEIISNLQKDILDSVIKTSDREQSTNTPREIVPKKSVVHFVKSEQDVTKPLYTQKAFEDNAFLSNVESKNSQNHPFLESTQKLLQKPNETRCLPLVLPTNKQQAKVIQKRQDSDKNNLGKREKQFNTSTNVNTKPTIIKSARNKAKNCILNGLKFNDRKNNNNFVKKQPYKLNCQQTLKATANKFVQPNSDQRIPEKTRRFEAEEPKGNNYRKTNAGKSNFPIQPLFALQKCLKSNLAKINELNKTLNNSCACAVPDSAQNPLCQDLNECLKKTNPGANQQTEFIIKRTNPAINNKPLQKNNEGTNTKNSNITSHETAILEPLSSKKVFLETFGAQFTSAKKRVQNEDDSKKISELLNSHLLHLNDIPKLNISRQFSKSDSHIGKDQKLPVVLHQNKGIVIKTFSEQNLNFNKTIQDCHKISFKNIDKQNSKDFNVTGPQNKSVQCIRSKEYIISPATFHSPKHIQRRNNSGQNLDVFLRQPVSKNYIETLNDSQRTHLYPEIKVKPRPTSKYIVPKFEQKSDTTITKSKENVNQTTLKSGHHKKKKHIVSKLISRTKSTPHENSAHNLKNNILPQHSQFNYSIQKNSSKVKTTIPTKSVSRKFHPQRTYTPGKEKQGKTHTNFKNTPKHTVSKATSVSHSRSLLISSNIRDSKQKSHSTITSKTHPRSISEVKNKSETKFDCQCELGDACNVKKQGLLTQPEDIEQNNNNKESKVPNCLCITEEQYSKLYSAVADKKKRKLKGSYNSRKVNNLQEHTVSDQKGISIVLPKQPEICNSLSENINKLSIKFPDNQMSFRGAKQGGSPSPCGSLKQCVKCQNIIQPTCSGSPPKLCRKCKKPINPICPSYLPESSPCPKHANTAVPKSLKCAKCQAPITRVENRTQYANPQHVKPGPIYGKPLEADELRIKQEVQSCQIPNKKPTCHHCQSSNTQIVYPLFLKSKQELDIENKCVQTNLNEYKQGNSYQEQGKIPKQLDLYNSCKFPSIITCPSAPPKDLFEYPSSIQSARL